MAEAWSGRVRVWQQATVETVFCRLRDRHLYPKGKKKRQSSRARVLTGHHKATICEGVYTNTWRVVEGTKTGTQTEAITQAQKKFTYNMYGQQHVKGYTQTHWGWYKALKQRKKVHRHRQLHRHSEAITYNMYIQQQKRGRKEHRVHGKAHMGILAAHKKPHTPPQRIARRKPLTEEAPPDHSGRLHQGPRSYKIGKDGRTCSEVVGEKRVSWCPEPIG